MTPRRWAVAAALVCAAFGIGYTAAAQSDRVLHDPTGYRTRDPALPAESPYVRRPLPSYPWIPPATLETR